MERETRGDCQELFPQEELQKLDNQLCFALYVTSKEIIKNYKPLLDPLGLTYTAYIALLALWEEEGIALKELGRKLYLDSGTLTPLLKKMEVQGLVTRRRDPEDERVVRVFLTPQGRSMKEKAAHIPSTLICASDIDPERGRELLRLLHQTMKQF